MGCIVCVEIAIISFIRLIYFNKETNKTATKRCFTIKTKNSITLTVAYMLVRPTYVELVNTVPNMSLNHITKFE